MLLNKILLNIWSLSFMSPNKEVLIVAQLESTRCSLFSQSILILTIYAYFHNFPHDTISSFFQSHFNPALLLQAKRKQELVDKIAQSAQTMGQDVFSTLGNGRNMSDDF